MLQEVKKQGIRFWYERTLNIYKLSHARIFSVLSCQNLINNQAEAVETLTPLVEQG